MLILSILFLMKWLAAEWTGGNYLIEENDSSVLTAVRRLLLSGDFNQGERERKYETERQI